MHQNLTSASKQISSCYKNISVLEGSRSHDSARNSLSQKVLGSQAKPLQLGPPANSKEKRNQQTQKCLLVGRTREEGRVQDQQFHTMDRCSSQCRTECTHGLDTVSWDMGPWLGTHGMGGEVEFPSLS